MKNTNPSADLPHTRLRCTFTMLFLFAASLRHLAFTSASILLRYQGGALCCVMLTPVLWLSYCKYHIIRKMCLSLSFAQEGLVCSACQASWMLAFICPGSTLERKEHNGRHNWITACQRLCDFLCVAEPTVLILELTEVAELCMQNAESLLNHLRSQPLYTSWHEKRSRLNFLT